MKQEATSKLTGFRQQKTYRIVKHTSILQKTASVSMLYALFTDHFFKLPHIFGAFLELSFEETGTAFQSLLLHRADNSQLSLCVCALCVHMQKALCP